SSARYIEYEKKTGVYLEAEITRIRLSHYKGEKKKGDKQEPHLTVVEKPEHAGLGLEELVFLEAGLMTTKCQTDSHVAK
ncbi:hypothetical protein E2562_028591, partial [Oryza meyeriana var. granulata]